MFFDYVREQCGVSFCFQTIKHELGFRKRVVSTVEHRRGGKYPFRGHPNLDAWKINFLLQFSAQLKSYKFYVLLLSTMNQQFFHLIFRSSKLMIIFYIYHCEKKIKKLRQNNEYLL